jgi:protein PhnA
MKAESAPSIRSLSLEFSTLVFRRRAALHPPVSEISCAMCEMTELLIQSGHYECLTCGHEWQEQEIGDAHAPRIVKDAYGSLLSQGDIVAMIKDLKLKGSSKVLKVGTKSKPIRIVDGDHEISCKMDGLEIGLKACFVKKVTA